jgi:hypothetical protein
MKHYRFSSNPRISLLKLPSSSCRTQRFPTVSVLAYLSHIRSHHIPVLLLSPALLAFGLLRLNQLHSAQPCQRIPICLINPRAVSNQKSSDLYMAQMISLDVIFKIFCYVPGSGSLFPVDLDLAKNQTVGELKAAIWRKKKHEFADTDCDALVLWKVRPLCGQSCH